jgi:hypothetical protein
MARIFTCGGAAFRGSKLCRCWLLS